LNGVSNRSLVAKVRDDSFSGNVQIGKMIDGILQRFRSPRDENNSTPRTA
jgi:hypothetical protein